MYFSTQLKKFWKFHGEDLVVPEIEGKSLDFHKLHRAVNQLGGFETACKDKYWRNVAGVYGCRDLTSGFMLKGFYEKILMPFLIYMSAAEKVI